MQEELTKKLKYIIKHFGIANQLIKLNEETAELMLECTRDNYDGIVEELADVLNLLKQIQVFYDIDDKEIDFFLEGKVDRTLKRIKEGYYNEHR